MSDATTYDVIDVEDGAPVAGVWVGVTFDKASRAMMALSHEGRRGLGIIRHGDPHAEAVACARARSAVAEAELSMDVAVPSKREPLAKRWVRLLAARNAADEALRRARGTR